MYKEISDYGLIGDMHAAALVSKDGSIDYCSMPHIDSPTIFAAILDDEKGGFFSIRPRNGFQSEQSYIKDTNILRCEFRTSHARAELIDFMPVRSGELFEKEEHAIHRCLKVLSGTMDFVLKLYPRPDYARKTPSVFRENNLFKITGGNKTFTFAANIEKYEIIKNRSGGFVMRFSLKKGESAHFGFTYGYKEMHEIIGCSFAATRSFWHGWLHKCAAGQCSFFGEYTDMINRSLLVLKLLTFQPTGAIAAAATTSLPESIGNTRNWDYRFTWLRDASFTLKAMFAIAHITEADSFIHWLHRTYQKYGSRSLQVMYSLEGERDLKEVVLGHLKGYKNSRPVRVGNAAFKQKQWDVYGEVMDTALRLSDYAGKIDEGLWPFFKDVCNQAIQSWRNPDDGIWEARNGPFHFVYSKVMCWVALDRGIKIAGRYGFDAPLEAWENEKNAIREDVLKNGYDSALNSFVQRYDSKDLDSSLLLLALIDFLPINDKRIQGTIKACKRDLMENGFLLRYRSSDGLEGEESGFVLCNFWLVECLALSGKISEAREVLSKTVKAANHLSLFSEEYDYRTAEQLGNFPQAFSHIGYINSVLAILNIQNKISQEPRHAPLVERIRKLIPVKIVLNKIDKRFDGTGRDIAGQLKISLNNLQGAFFDALEGRVNYDSMRQSANYKGYLILAQKLNGFDPFGLKSDDEKKAFWINIYNILIIHGVIELNIKDSVKEVFNFFGRIGYSIGGLFITPDDIEHGILRGNRPHPATGLKQFSMLDKRRKLCMTKFDPRIHFALVCASSSCPPIEFYDEARIGEQLDIAARSFIKRRGVLIDKRCNIVYLSQIFKWYEKDLSRDKPKMLEYVMNFADEDTKKYIIEKKGAFKIRYSPYNWNLNKALE